MFFLFRSHSVLPFIYPVNYKQIISHFPKNFKYFYKIQHKIPSNLCILHISRGIIISKTEAENKINLNHKKQKSNYILQIKEIYSKVEINTYIDAETFGGVGRFINHSCDPNLYFEFVRISHFIPHVAFYANRKILKGEELTFMYCDIAEGDSTSSLSYKKCECGANHELSGA